MRTRVISLGVAFIASMALLLGIGGHASAVPLAPTSGAVQLASIGQIVVPMKKKAKKPPKWVCSRIYIEGKPKYPTAVKVWCNGGKTLVKLGTKGMKPGSKNSHSHSTVRYFKTKKGKYSGFIVAFNKYAGAPKGVLQVYYKYGERPAIAFRNPFGETAKQTHVLWV